MADPSSSSNPNPASAPTAFPQHVTRVVDNYFQLVPDADVYTQPDQAITSATQALVQVLYNHLYERYKGKISRASKRDSDSKRAASSMLTNTSGPQPALHVVDMHHEQVYQQVQSLVNASNEAARKLLRKLDTAGETSDSVQLLKPLFDEALGAVLGDTSPRDGSDLDNEADEASDHDPDSLDELAGGSEGEGGPQQGDKPSKKLHGRPDGGGVSKGVSSAPNGKGKKKGISVKAVHGNKEYDEDDDVAMQIEYDLERAAGGEEVYVGDGDGQDDEGGDDDDEGGDGGMWGELYQEGSSDEEDEDLLDDDSAQEEEHLGGDEVALPPPPIANGEVGGQVNGLVDGQELPPPPPVQESKFERQQRTMASVVAQMEKSLEKEWHMLGEAKAGARPHNSLLNLNLTYDSNQKQAPEPSVELRNNIDDIIKARIQNNTWDDVKLPPPPPADDKKAKLILKDTQAAVGLAEEYEQDLMTRRQEAAGQLPGDDIREQVLSVFKQLWVKLDELQGLPVNKGVKNKQGGDKDGERTDVASVQIEQIQAMDTEMADTRAPQEIYAPKKTDMTTQQDYQRTTASKRRKRKLRNKQPNQNKKHSKQIIQNQANGHIGTAKS